MVNEIAYDLIDVLPQNYPVGQDAFDRLRHPPQAFGSLSMFSFKVTERLPPRWDRAPLVFSKTMSSLGWWQQSG
jgi:hypothetical protein